MMLISCSSVASPCEVPGGASADCAEVGSSFATFLFVGRACVVDMTGDPGSWSSWLHLHIPALLLHEDWIS